MSLTSETEHPFFITVDASLIELGAVLFHLNEQNNMKVISYNSRILNPQEQKLSTLDRELLGIVHTLQIYEFLIIVLPIQYMFLLITNLFYIVLQKRLTLVLVSIELKCNQLNFQNSK